MDIDASQANYAPVTVASPGVVAGSIIAAVVIVGALFLVSMFLYFVVRRRYAHCKWAVEIGFVGFAVLLAAGLNVFLYCFANRHDITFGSAVAYTFHGLFNGIGHLTFNGADSAADALPYPFFCLYYGSALYAALMFFGILSAKANYEFFSKLVLLLPAAKKDVYVFTALNEETLMLAKSLAQHNACPEDGTRPKSCVVAFAIPTQKPFDRHDELCREVMSNGFYYWSYSPDVDKKVPWALRAYRRLAGQKGPTFEKQSIARALHLNNRNCVQNKDNRFYVFAFDSENYIPKEEQNMATVFDDIDRRGASAKNDGLRINYVILTKRQVKYAAYDYKLRELRLNYYLQLKRQYDKSPLPVLKYLRFATSDPSDEKYGVPPIGAEAFFSVPEDIFKDYLLAGRIDKANVVGRYQAYVDRTKRADAPAEATAARKQYLAWTATWLDRVFKKRFTVEIWDEANVIAKSVADGATDLLCEIFARPDPSVKVLTLGFGETGTAATMALYSHAAFVDQAHRANAFSARVYDVASAGIGSGFARERPYSCVSVTDGKVERVIRNRADVDRQMLLLNAAFKTDDLLRQMQYPQMNFVLDDCRNLAFLDLFDHAEDSPDFVVVATGDDYTNVRMANAITQKLVNDALTRRVRRVDVFVNVWDRANNDLLISGGGKWHDGSTLLVPRPDGSGRIMLAVHIVGNNEHVYSADTTVVFDGDAAFNHYYNVVTEQLMSATAIDDFSQDFLDEMGRFILRPDNTPNPDYAKMVRWTTAFTDRLSNPLTDGTLLDRRLEYYGLELWIKESNAMACHNAQLYYRLMTDWRLGSADVSDEEKMRRYAQLSDTEHQRWLRLHIAFGWIYNGKSNKQELVQQHNCLTPFAFVKGNTMLYDLANVLMAWRYGVTHD